MSTTARVPAQGPLPPKISRAVRLLRQLVETQLFEREALARELVVPPTHLDAYVAGTLEIPLDRQLCLALLVIERVPALARQGHGLRGQVIAATAYASHTFSTDAAPPTFMRGR